LDWGSAYLNIINFTLGVDTLRFGTDNTGLTEWQLHHTHFLDSGFEFAGIDANGYLSPIPEPSAAAMVGVGLGLLVFGKRKGFRGS
jgi:hypothetical protein